MGGIYKNEAASAFGIFKFVQSGGSALAFLYSPVLGFHLQVMMMMMMIMMMIMVVMTPSAADPGSGLLRRHAHLCDSRTKIQKVSVIQ